MTNRTRKSTTWIALESGGPGVDPSADGSGYVHVPTMGTGADFIDDETELLDTDFEIGRNEETAPIAGAQSWRTKFVTPLIGLAAAAGDGVTPGADDWLDFIMLHLFGTQAVRPGEGVGVGSTVSSIVADSDVYSVEDLLPIVEAGLPAAGAVRAQWGHVETDAGSGTYGIVPSIAAAPTTAAIIYGTKLYYPDADHRGGSTISLVRQEDDGLFLGRMGRMTGAKIIIPARKMARLEVSIEGTQYGPTTKASLPTPLPLATTPLRGLLSPINFGGTSYQTDSIEIDLMPTALPRETTDTEHGVANREQMSLRPKVAIAPLFAQSIQDLRSQVTAGRLLVQLGAGTLVSGYLGTMAIWVGAAHARTVKKTDKNGRIHAALELQAHAGGILSGAARRYVMIARA